MHPRRSLLAILTALLCLVSAVPVTASPLTTHAMSPSISTETDTQVRSQVGTGLVSVELWTCDVVRTADVITLTTTLFKPDGAYPCVDGLPSGSTVTIDGVEPDLVNDTTAIWFTVFYGNHRLSAGTNSNALSFDLNTDSIHFYALYERAQLPGGWAEVHILDCAVAPMETTVLTGEEDTLPEGFSICVPGNLEKRNYGLVVDGEGPTYSDTNTATWQLSGGTHVATAIGGARYEFEINDWTVSMNLYAKGEVSSSEPPDGETPVDSLPNTGVGSVTQDAEESFALLVASIALGYVSYRTARMGRA